MREFIYWHRYAFLVFFRFYHQTSRNEMEFMRLFAPDAVSHWDFKVKFATLMEQRCEEGMQEFALPKENDPIHFSAN